jgi:hypothetical protein
MSSAVAVCDRHFMQFTMRDVNTALDKSFAIQTKQIEAIVKLWHTTYQSDEKNKNFFQFIANCSENEKKRQLHLLFMYFQRVMLGQMSIQDEELIRFYDDFEQFLQYLMQTYPQLNDFIEEPWLKDGGTEIPILHDKGFAEVIDNYLQRGKLLYPVVQCVSIWDFFNKLLELKEKPEHTRGYFVVRNIGNPMFDQKDHRFAVIAYKENNKVNIILSDSVGLEDSPSFGLFEKAFEIINSSTKAVKKYGELIQNDLGEFGVITTERQADCFTCASFALKDLIFFQRHFMEELSLEEDPNATVLFDHAKDLCSAEFVGYRASVSMSKSSQFLTTLPANIMSKIAAKHLREVDTNKGRKIRNLLAKDRVIKMLQIVLQKVVFKEVCK